MSSYKLPWTKIFFEKKKKKKKKIFPRILPLFARISPEFDTLAICFVCLVGGGGGGGGAMSPRLIRLWLK